MGGGDVGGAGAGGYTALHDCRRSAFKLLYPFLSRVTVRVFKLGQGPGSGSIVGRLLAAVGVTVTVTATVNFCPGGRARSESL